MSSAAPRLDDLLARLPAGVVRGHVLLEGSGERGVLPCGLPPLDRALGGGFPCGRLSQVSGRGSAGATSLLYRLLARTTEAGRLVAWVDGPDAFDPESASASGVVLDRVLWLRPGDGRTAFAVAEQVLVLGGFALVVLDVEYPPRAANAPWLRLARAAERSATALVAIEGAHRTVHTRFGGPSSSFVFAVCLELAPARALWDRTGGAPALFSGLALRAVVKRNRRSGGEQSIAIALG